MPIYVSYKCNARTRMEKSAFEQQARTWREKALGVCLSCGAGKDEAEDIAQNVMLRLWQVSLYRRRRPWKRGESAVLTGRKCRSDRAKPGSRLSCT